MSWKAVCCLYRPQQELAQRASSLQGIKNYCPTITLLKQYSIGKKVNKPSSSYILVQLEECNRNSVFLSWYRALFIFLGNQR